MDDVNRFARELADAIAAAVAANPEVEACRERARAAGFEMRVSLKAMIGFHEPTEAVRAGTKEPQPRPRRCPPPPACRRPQRTFDITANDRRLLRSLRIAADATPEEVD